MTWQRYLTDEEREKLRKMQELRDVSKSDYNLIRNRFKRRAQVRAGKDTDDAEQDTQASAGDDGRGA